MCIGIPFFFYSHAAYYPIRKCDMCTCMQHKHKQGRCINTLLICRTMLTSRTILTSSLNTTLLNHRAGRGGEDLDHEVEEIDVEDDAPHSPRNLRDENEDEGVIGGVSPSRALLHRPLGILVQIQLLSKQSRTRMKRACVTNCTRGYMISNDRNHILKRRKSACAFMCTGSWEGHICVLHVTDTC
jgi:hypothetical protein